MPNNPKHLESENRIGEAPGNIRKFRPENDGYRWSDVPLKRYKEDGSHFRKITRQTLFSGRADSGSEMRYFEIGAGGHSTFERHVHTHSVLVLRGRGRVLVGASVRAVEAFDLIDVPSRTWHQFRADDEPLGFLCLVACDRDRPTRPTPDEQDVLRTDPVIAAFARF